MIQLAVLPVGHRRARSRAAGGWCSASTKVSSRTSAAFLKPASRSPYVHSSVVLPIGSWPGRAFGEVLLGPLQLFDFGRGGVRRLRPGGGGAGRTQTLPCRRARSGRRAAGSRSDRRRTAAARTRCRSFRSLRPRSARRRRRRRESARPGRAARWSAPRSPCVLAWTPSPSVAPAAGAGQVVGGQDRLDAGHRQRRARVDARHARVRHRAEQQLREQHAVGAVVLGVLRLAGDLRDEVGRRVVLADQLAVSAMITLSACAQRRASAR